MTKRGCIWII